MSIKKNLAQLDNDHEHALKKFGDFRLDLCKRRDPLVILRVPIIAFAGQEIAWGETGRDFGKMHCVSFPVAALTNNVMVEITPEDLGTLLFSKQVAHVTEAVLCGGVMAALDAERHGLNPASKDLIEVCKAELVNCFVNSFQALQAKFQGNRGG